MPNLPRVSRRAGEGGDLPVRRDTPARDSANHVEHTTRKGAARGKAPPERLHVGERERVRKVYF